MSLEAGTYGFEMSITLYRLVSGVLARSNFKNVNLPASQNQHQLYKANPATSSSGFPSVSSVMEVMQSSIFESICSRLLLTSTKNSEGACGLFRNSSKEEWMNRE